MSQRQLPHVSNSIQSDGTLLQPKRKRARAVCKQMMEPEIQKACRLFASRMERVDKEHDWVCIGVQKRSELQIFTYLQDFAASGNHKFATFDQDDLKFGILGVRKHIT